MELQIKVEDYLTEDRIREICEDAVKRSVFQYLSNEDNFNRIITNNAYFLIQKCVDEHLSDKKETFEEIIKRKVSEVLDKGFNSWDVFRYKDTYQKDNIGVELLNEAIRDSKKQIVENVEKVVADYPYKEIREEIQDTLWEVLNRKLFGEE